ncbi:MAG TPA: DUF5318 domain-containing protein [Candidatus Corynebacterium avicola]|uniref:DUF5318 domain-containing protein n=1 Tax=Candidatus Corynebacterium avicola TaxID=2838527 RepID=A0A9D1RN88_9CORY|nr:DUF5318 domain-containing protein [Candidatus Corynebacterium avicola]
MREPTRISHDLDRRRTLRAFRAGELSRSEVCDAGRSLRSSAEVLGVRSESPCPLCDSCEVREVAWVYGSAIAEKSGTARSLSEIRAIVATLFPDGDVQSAKELTVHTVEVCLRCGWNHLLREDTYRAGAESTEQESPATERPAR